MAIRGKQRTDDNAITQKGFRVTILPPWTSSCAAPMLSSTICCARVHARSLYSREACVRLRTYIRLDVIVIGGRFSSILFDAP